MPLHPRESMKRNRKVKTEITTPGDIIFINQVPVHPRKKKDKKKKKKQKNKVRKLRQSD